MNRIAVALIVVVAIAVGLAGCGGETTEFTAKSYGLILCSYDARFTPDFFGSLRIPLGVQIGFACRADTGILTPISYEVSDARILGKVGEDIYEARGVGVATVTLTATWTQGDATTTVEDKKRVRVY